FHLIRRNELVLPADEIESDAGSTQRHLGLLVKRDRWRRVERDAIPDQLRAMRVNAGLPCKRPREIGAFHFETARPDETLVKRDVVQQRSQGDDFPVMVDVPNLSDAYGEQPGPNYVVEKIRLAVRTRIFHGTGNGRRVR